MTKEQKQLLEATAKKLYMLGSNLGEKKAGEIWERSKIPPPYKDDWRNAARIDALSLLKVQQAAGAVLKDSDQTEPEPLPEEKPEWGISPVRFLMWTDCWEAVQANKFVKVIPLLEETK
jgi:hypothetical protein